MSISFVTAVWGDYWDRFGASFVESLAAMDPQPDEIVLVCESDHSAPPWIRQIRPRSSVRKWDWFNEAVEASSADWVMVGSVDDVMLPDGLADLNLTGDFVATACWQNEVIECCPDTERWERILNLDETAIWTAAVFRRDVFLRFPWRQVVFPDWMQWLELRAAGASISFDRKPRFIHSRWRGSHTWEPSELGDSQIREMREMLAKGPVTPGVEWPPA